MRLAVIDSELCQPKKCGGACANFCPKNRAEEKCITIGKKARIDEDLCIGCGICVKKCPLKAIDVVNLPEEMKEAPVHRFGENQFALFRLPIPIFGKSIGLVGQNGTGKSTALKILSGEIKPNLGNFEKEPHWSEIMRLFQGTELVNYLEKLSKNEVKISLKPQQITLLPNYFQGNVKELLKKSDQTGKFNEMVRSLELEEALQRDIKELSGGELQRVAVAATVMKDADFYFFDEPSSHLDVKQRLLTAKVIRSLLQEKKSVMLVEHDLTILDYLTDEVHILYGKPAVFGIVSKLYGSRAGINSYLEGFIRQENVRFRDYSMHFEITPPLVQKKDELLLTYERFDCGYDNFSLSVESGDIYKGEIIGIMGPNAIGKTTFVKNIAEKIKDLKISYKPQYIKFEDKGVGDLLVEAAGNNFYTPLYKTEIIVPFSLEKLLEKNISELSGGELQRVAIAHALSKPSDLLLLDEPSAFLDIEQRLLLAKTLKRFSEEHGTAVFIVEHDLQVLDAVSNRVILFEGIPGRSGTAHAPQELRRSLNKFLKILGVTMRRDVQTNRPRINKLNSVKDREQKERGEYYYSS